MTWKQDNIHPVILKCLILHFLKMKINNKIVTNNKFIIINKWLEILFKIKLILRLWIKVNNKWRVSQASMFLQIKNMQISKHNNINPIKFKLKNLNLINKIYNRSNRMHFRVILLIFKNNNQIIITNHSKSIATNKILTEISSQYIIF